MDRDDLIIDAIRASQDQWGPGSETASLITLADYITLRVDDSIDLQFSSADGTSRVSNTLVAGRPERREFNLPFAVLSISSNGSTKLQLDDLAAELEPTIASLQDDTTAMSRYAQGFYPLAHQFSIARPLAIDTPIPSKLAERIQPVWQGALGTVHDALTKRGLPHHLFTRLPCKDKWHIYEYDDAFKTRGLEAANLPLALHQAFTTGFVQHGGRSCDARCIYIPVHFRAVPTVVLALEGSWAEADWLRLLRFYRGGSLVSDIRRRLEYQELMMIRDLLLKTIDKPRLLEKEGEQSFERLWSVLPCVFPTTHPALADDGQIVPGRPGPFLSCGVVLPTGKAHDLWSRSDESLLIQDMLAQVRRMRGTCISDPYYIHCDKREDPPRIVITERLQTPCSKKKCAQFDRNKMIEVPKEFSSLLLALVLARKDSNTYRFGAVSKELVTKIQAVAIDRLGVARARRGQPARSGATGENGVSQGQRQRDQAATIIDGIRRALVNKRPGLISGTKLIDDERGYGWRLEHTVKVCPSFDSLRLEDGMAFEEGWGAHSQTGDD